MLMHHVTAALRAHALFTRDVDYIVKDGEVIIVDEHTGRTMQGRRWSDGLHRAVEAKEGVDIQTKTRRWRQSPSRTTSVCTRSWRDDRKQPIPKRFNSAPSTNWIPWSFQPTVR